jgi:hypothetical protein
MEEQAMQPNTHMGWVKHLNIHRFHFKKMPNKLPMWQVIINESKEHEQNRALAVKGGNYIVIIWVRLYAVV